MAKNVRIDYSGLDRKINSLYKKIDQGSTLTCRQLAQVGVHFAFNLAPKDSGKSAANIYAKPSNQSKSVKSWIIQAKEAHKFPVVRVMHKDDDFSNYHWRRRTEKERRFMNTTRDYLNSIKGKVASGNFRNVNITK